MIDDGKPSLAEIAHHGIKGMHWGHRQAALPASTSSNNSQPTKASANVNGPHKQMVKRLSTPEAAHRMQTSTKAKIAVGTVVAARVLYVVGRVALNQIVNDKLGANAASAAGPKALTSIATATKYAKRSRGAFKITNL